MLGKLIFFLSVATAQSQLSALSFGLLDANGTQVDAGETPMKLQIGFTTGSANTNQVVVGCPSGLLAGDGSFSVGGGRRLDEEDSDWSYERRLAATCEPYGTAVVSGGGTILTVQVRAVSGGGPCPAGSTVDMTLSPSGAASFSSVSTGTLAFTVATDADSTPISISYTVDSTPGSNNIVVIGDPITWYNGMKYKFWLPIGELMPLLETDEMTVWASTFQGWSRTCGHQSPSCPRRFQPHTVPQQLQSVGHQDEWQAHPSSWTTTLRSEEQQQANQDWRWRTPSGSPTFSSQFHPGVCDGTNGSTIEEVESDSISFMIHGSHAGAEFPGDFDKQVKYTHLDWVTLEMVDAKENGWKGILPQIWRIQPRTAEVEDLLIAPSKKQMAVSNRYRMTWRWLDGWSQIEASREFPAEQPGRGAEVTKKQRQWLVQQV